MRFITIWCIWHLTWDDYDFINMKTELPCDQIFVDREAGDNVLGSVRPSECLSVLSCLFVYYQYMCVDSLKNAIDQHLRVVFSHKKWVMEFPSKLCLYISQKNRDRLRGMKIRPSLLSLVGQWRQPLIILYKNLHNTRSDAMSNRD